MLLNSNLEPWRIGTSVGYSGIDAFSRAFKRWSGQRPTAYRKEPRRRVSGEKVADGALLNETDLNAALDGKLDPDQAEILAYRIRSIEARLQVNYPNLLQMETPQCQGVVGAEFVEATMVAQLWERIRNKPWQEQRSLVRSQLCLSTPVLFDFLCRKSREEGREDCQVGIELAKLALASLDAIADPLGNRLPNYRTKAWAWIGNAHRLALDFPASEKAFASAEAEYSVIPEEHRDPLCIAETYDLEAALRMFQRRFPEAQELVDLAIPIFRSLGTDARLAEALIARSNISHYAGKPMAAIPDLLEALELIEDRRDPFLMCLACMNLAAACCATKQYEKFEKFHHKARELCKEIGSNLLGHQLQWIEGIAAQDCQDLDTAEKLFQQAHRGFIDIEAIDHAAVVALDLAMIHSIRREHSQAFEVVAKAVPVFEALQDHREGITALSLLRNALMAGTVSFETLTTIRDLVEKIREDPRPRPAKQENMGVGPQPDPHDSGISD